MEVFNEPVNMLGSVILESELKEKKTSALKDFQNFIDESITDIFMELVCDLSFIKQNKE